LSWIEYIINIVPTLRYA